jgi:glutaredoxin
MLDRVREALFAAITTPRGDSLAAVRVPKDLARRLNATLGQPLATRDELAKRSKARARLAELRAAGAKAGPVKREDAPVVIYFEKDRNVRELVRVEELLAAKGYSWKRLDVVGDEATLDFVMTKAKCEQDDLPVVFVADHVVGTYTALVEADVSGELARLVRG